MFCTSKELSIQTDFIFLFICFCFFVTHTVPPRILKTWIWFASKIKVFMVII